MLKEQRYFKGWVFDGVCFEYNDILVKLLTIEFTFRKLKGNTNDILNQELCKLKNRPESFVQKVPSLAKSKLVLKPYNELYVFKPSLYSTYKLLREDADGYDFSLYRASKLVELVVHNFGEDSANAAEEQSGYKYKFEPYGFQFIFSHPLSGKDIADKLYQLIKDEYCVNLREDFGNFFRDDVGVPTEYAGKFCPDRRPFTYRELLPNILKSMHKQFDFLEEDGKRMEWYEELLSEIQQPTLYVSKKSVETFKTFNFWSFYDTLYASRLEKWNRKCNDALLGDEMEET